MQGEVISNALDFISKEIVRMSEERKIASMVKLANFTRRQREAEEVLARTHAHIHTHTHALTHTHTHIHTHAHTHIIYIYIPPGELRVPAAARESRRAEP